MQIPENVTLTIEPGATVTRPTSGDMFLLLGTVYAHGTINNKIVFDGGGNSEFFTTWGGAGNAYLDYCIIRNGYRFWNRGGYFSLTHSELTNLTHVISLQSPSADICIEYNKFVNTAGLHAYQAAGRFCKIYVRYNLFQKLSSSIHNAGGSPGLNEMIVKYNSFIDIDGIILSLCLDFDTAVMNATENYWGTLDTDVINPKIQDRNDDIRIKNYIDFIPILTEPHSDTPKISSTIYVDDDNTAGPWDGTAERPYQNITQGLKHASDNDKIFVFSGTYYENVVVNKTLSLVGENRETTIIDGNRTGNVVCVEAEHVTVAVFTVQNSGPEGYGIYLYYGSSYSNISHNIIKKNKWGIKSETGRPPDHDCNIIVGNDILSSRYAGIELTLSNDNVIANNSISDGILLCYSGNNTIYGNHIPHGGMNTRYGSINLRTVSDSTVIYNNVSGRNVIRLDESDNNEIAGNSIRGGQRAIMLEDSHDNAITHNNISGSDYQAIYMIRAENNTISNNTALQNDGGFYLMSKCKNNIISNNDISYNGFNALYLDDYSDQNTFINNTISFSHCGVYIRNSWYNMIFHNNF